MRFLLPFFLVAVVGLWTPQTALADEPSGPSAALATFWDKAEEAREAAIAGTAAQIAQAKRDLEMAKRTPIKSNAADGEWPVAWGLPKDGFPGTRAKEKFLAAKGQRLVELTAWQANLMDSRREFLPEIDPARPQIGAMGKIAEYVLNGPYAEQVWFQVVQVIEGDELLVTFGEASLPLSQVTAAPRAAAAGTQAAYDAVRRPMQPTPTPLKQQTYWVRNLSTAGLVDGARIKLDGLWSLTGTKQYQNVLGAARTVYLLDKLDLDELRKARPEPPSQPAPMPAPAEPEKPSAKYVVHFTDGRKLKAVDYKDQGTRYLIQSLGTSGSGSYPKSMIEKIEPLEP